MMIQKNLKKKKILKDVLNFYIRVYLKMNIYLKLNMKIQKIIKVNKINL